MLVFRAVLCLNILKEDMYENNLLSELLKDHPQSNHCIEINIEPFDIQTFYFIHFKTTHFYTFCIIYKQI